MHCHLRSKTLDGPFMSQGVNKTGSMFQTELEVFRKSSKNLPSLDDPESCIDWEETVYLNLILQQVSITHPPIQSSIHPVIPQWASIPGQLSCKYFVIRPF